MPPPPQPKITTTANVKRRHQYLDHKPTTTMTTNGSSTSATTDSCSNASGANNNNHASTRCVVHGHCIVDTDNIISEQEEEDQDRYNVTHTYTNDNEVEGIDVQVISVDDDDVDFDIDDDDDDDDNEYNEDYDYDYNHHTGTGGTNANEQCVDLDDSLSFVIDDESIHPDVLTVKHDSPKQQRAGIKESLFGDNRANKEPIDIGSKPERYIRKRSLLPWSVTQQQTLGISNNKWTVTMCTNQKALENDETEDVSKTNLTYNLSSKKIATDLALSLTTPRMSSFTDNPKCFICTSKFAVFRRPCHCRNCGVSVCNACTIKWSSKLVPTSYNIKNTSSVSICIACEWLHEQFRCALLNGQYDESIKLYNSGNINLRSPFKTLYSNSSLKVYNEQVYPIHCAVIGGNLKLLQWLIDDHSCPIRSFRRTKRNNQQHSSSMPIVSSRGRTLLSIALTNRSNSIGIIRYLVADKNMSFFDEGKNLHLETILLNFTSTLQLLSPNDIVNNNKNDVVVVSEEERRRQQQKRKPIALLEEEKRLQKEEQEKKQQQQHVPNYIFCERNDEVNEEVTTCFQ